MIARANRASVHDSIKHDQFSLDPRLGFGKVDWPLREGKELLLGGKEIELERAITKADYLSGRCFGRSDGSPSAPTLNSQVGLSKKFIPLKINMTSTPKPHNPSTSVPGRRNEPLQPVDPISVGNNLPLKNTEGIGSGGSHWTANWYAYRNVYITCLTKFLGVRNRPGSIRRGMAMRMYP